MKKIIYFCIVALITLNVSAQEINVRNFRMLDSDLTANTTGTIEIDQNGETAALIKVVTTQTGFTFDCGAMGIVKTLQKPSEIWVYVPHGVKKITISHPQLGLLRDFYFNIPIESAKTYEMVLTTGSVQTIVTQTANGQYLVIKVTPYNAVVELNNETLPVVDGIAQKFVKLGTYEYRIQAQNYHPSAGKVTVDDPNNKKTINVELDPAFGWIEIGKSEELEGAQVFIDNALVGIAPLKSKELPSGIHNIKIVKPLFMPFEQTVTVYDNQVTAIAPTMSADYSTVTLKVNNEADIYVNGEKKGKSSWTGRLASGTYVLEAKLDNHKSTILNKEISSNQKQQTIQLDSPIPIWGTLNIISSPAIADVFIDNKNIGQTPLFIKHLVGNYDLTISKTGYGVYRTEVTITENQQSDIKAELVNVVPIIIDCNYNNATLYIDNKYEGNIEGMKMISVGKHHIKIEVSAFSEYVSFEGDIEITGAEKRIPISLEKKNLNVTFYCDLPNPYISIDGKSFDTKMNYVLTNGIHEIAVRHKSRKELRSKIKIDSKNTYFYISFNKREINVKSASESTQGLFEKTKQSRRNKREVQDELYIR